ncbi:aminotransferase class III-fold pyridoxal phosphate-dependent enzyme [Pseudomonas fluorescens]|uniref:aminotransferase class III-fold pyridoxal phosphate-dependent enzyme n=1 Tax=Pseudomonas fluorescens TaxID=294 RepID=UPI00177C6440|nr:aminotransferase class III-fold pyridoxal phosphate-dependent enzyme [Pseudomonas fluorescens]
MNCKVVSKAERETFWLSNGDINYDLSGGFGYHVKEVQDAAMEQIQNRVGLSSRVLLSTPLLQLCETLSTWLGPRYENSYVCNSGDEAFEGALKLARALNPGRKTLAYVAHNHYGQMSHGQLLKPSAAQRELAAYLGIRIIPISTAAELEAFDAWEDCFAFCHGPFTKTETDQRMFMPLASINRAQRAASQHGVLSIYSDLDTCLGHLGHKLSHTLYGGTPDVIVMGNNLGGGCIPIGTYTTRHELANAVYGRSSPAKHGSTTAGNPPACVAALAALHFAQTQSLWNNAAENGKLIELALQEFAPTRFGGWVSLTFANEPHAREVHANLGQAGFHLSSPEGAELIIRPPLTARKEVVSSVAHSILDLLKNAYQKVA